MLVVRYADAYIPESSVEYLLQNINVNNSSWLHVIIIKKMCHVVSPMLYDLFNKSVALEISPDEFKVFKDKLIRLHKSGSKTDVKNFRPITTLLIFSKVFEKLVHGRLLCFIGKFNLLNSNQFGFEKG